VITVFSIQAALIIILLAHRTRRKRAEDALRESEDRYRSVIDDISKLRRTEVLFRRFFELPLVGMAITSPNRRFLLVNHRLCYMLGYTEQELTGMTWVEVTHPDDIAENARLLEQTLRGETDGYRMDKRFIHRDGQIVYASISARCVRKEDGTVDHLVLIVEDITLRKQAEEALRESEERSRQLTENLDAVLFISERLSGSVPLRVLYVSPSYEKVWGRPRESLYRETRSWLEGIHPDDREQVEAALPDVESGEFDQEYRIVRPDGGIRWVHDRVYPIYDDRGEIYRVAGIAEDITERKQAEESLAREKFFSDSTIDSLPGIFALIDGRGKYLRWNRNFERVTGYSREEILGMDPLGFFDGEDEQLIATKIGEAFAAGEATVEAELVSKDGRATPYFFTARRIHFDKRPCLIGMGFDITERKRAEEELRRLTARLLQLQDEERHRIASELHDSLGQSLAIIRNRATICLRSSADQEQVKEQLEEISATAAAAIDDVREIMHNLRPYELDRLGLVEAIESMTIKVSNSTAIRLRCELDRIEGLFTPEEETWIYRIVQEGLNNVVRHAEATEGRVVIRREGSEVIISVEDNGRGIEARAGEWNGKEAGGLGLAGIAERARMLGGTHEMRSEPGCGTTLTVRLGLRGFAGSHKP
jgi:PAS domain S-box-containing protein